MDAIFDRVVREFFPNTTIPFWKKWLFRTAFGNKVFSRLIYNERLVNKNGVEWVNAVVELNLTTYLSMGLRLLFQIIRRLSMDLA